MARRERARVVPLAVEPGRRTLVVSDVHGNLPLLRGALDKAGFGGDDVLIVLGDIVERNEGSLATLRYVMELCRTHTVYPVMGNCDHLVRCFVDCPEVIRPGFYPWWLGRMGGRSVLTQMADEIGVTLDAADGYRAAREAMREAFGAEFAFLRAMPHILLSEHYLFVHGGVPREERLEELDAYSCMKNDDFLGQGYGFGRWVVVGHWPVTLYHPDIPSAAPIILPERHIVSIDGGSSLKWDGQVNVLILPRTPDGAFTWVSEDGLPTVTALQGQAAGADSVNIRYGRSGLDVLERGAEFCRCRHRETGRELDVLTEYLFERDGETCCEDSTDYRLPVSPGDTLTVVRETSRGLLAKKDGVTGWYYGTWQA